MNDEMFKAWRESQGQPIDALPRSKGNAMSKTDELLPFAQYRRTQIAELRPWTSGDDMSRISISAPDKEAGSPKSGDMIARNPKNHDDQWLVAGRYFADNFEPLSAAGEAEDHLSEIRKAANLFRADDSTIWALKLEAAARFFSRTAQPAVKALLETLETTAQRLKNAEWEDGASSDHVRRVLREGADVCNAAIAALVSAPADPAPAPADVVETLERRFEIGERVTKIKGSSWTGRVVGFYATALTPIGYCVESENEPGSVQIYPEAAIRAMKEQENG